MRDITSGVEFVNPVTFLPTRPECADEINTRVEGFFRAHRSDLEALAQSWDPTFEQTPERCRLTIQPGYTNVGVGCSAGYFEPLRRELEALVGLPVQCESLRQF